MEGTSECNTEDISGNEPYFPAKPNPISNAIFVLNFLLEISFSIFSINLKLD